MMKVNVLQLALTKGVGDVVIKKAISFIDKSNYSWESLFTSRELLANSLSIRLDIADKVILMKERASDLYSKMIANDIQVIVESEDNYPNKLRTFLGKECPPILFVKGNVDLLNNCSVGFCGSRKTSEKGIEITKYCSKLLVKKDITVVSGYAAGTDLAAHRSALANGGNTVFVLAEGLFRNRIKGIIKEVLTPTNHVFISQFLPEMTWNVGNAMKRNNVIIGLSNAMVLVESGKSGGTFAAGEKALKVGSPLFVIDFLKPEISAEANPYFINKGGYPIRGKEGIPNLTNLFSILENDEICYRKNENEQLKINI